MLTLLLRLKSETPSATRAAHPGSLPEDAFLEDIQDPIYARQKIDHGLEDVEAGRTLSEEEFDQRMAKWLEL